MTETVRARLCLTPDFSNGSVAEEFLYFRIVMDDRILEDNLPKKHADRLCEKINTVGLKFSEAQRLIAFYLQQHAAEIEKCRKRSSEAFRQAEVKENNEQAFLNFRISRAERDRERMLATD